jgi:hypothetical protein
LRVVVSNARRTVVITARPKSLPGIVALAAAAIVLDHIDAFFQRLAQGVAFLYCLPRARITDTGCRAIVDLRIDA